MILYAMLDGKVLFLDTTQYNRKLYPPPHTHKHCCNVSVCAIPFHVQQMDIKITVNNLNTE